MQELNALKIIFILIPMYAANSGAMLFGGKTPLDFKTNIFGNGKTIKGTFFGILTGLIVSLTLNALFPETQTFFGNTYFFYASLLSIGAILGDLTGSFIKRRIGLKQGYPVMILDQTDFVFGGLFLGANYYFPTLLETITILITTIIAHKLVNLIAFKLKMKKVPW